MRFLVGLILGLSVAAFLWYIKNWENEREAWCESQKGVQVRTLHGDICIRAIVIRRP